MKIRSTFEQFCEAVDLPPQPPALIQQHKQEHISGQDIVAMLLVREAANQGTEGMQAVLDVLINRMHKDGKNLTEQALKFRQFSCLNNVIKNASGAHDAKTIDVEKLKSMIIESKNSPVFKTAYNLVLRADNGTLPDITNGATHYHVYRGPGKVSPSWTTPDLGGTNEHAQVTAKIGDHVFLKNV